MGITYDAAHKTAKKLWSEIDYCTEYDNAYVFSKKDDMSFGGNGPVVILKNSGEALDFTYYLDNLSGKYMREFAVDAYPGE